jgi:undecaprenyl-diphosphatase
VLAQPRFARKFIGFLLLTSVPAALIGVAFDSKVERFSTPDIAGAVSSGIDAQTFHYAPLVLGVAMILFGILLWAADKYTKRSEPLEKMTWVRALLIGAAQAVALVPGVSRSGATISVGLFLGYRRDLATRFAFLLAIPAVLASGLSQLKDVSASASPGLAKTFVATAVAFVVGYLVIGWLLRYLRTRTYLPFVIYRVALGTLVLVLLAFGVLDPTVAP